MIEKGRRKGTRRFTLKPPDGAGKAFLAGDFNNWQPARMRKQKDGRFVAVVALGPGTYEYKFLVDGEWVCDGDNECRALNPYGTTNSVAVIE